MGAIIDETLTADGNTAAIDWPGIPGDFVTQGTFGSGTAQLQYSIDGGGTWSNVPGDDATHTASTMTAFSITGCKLRVNLSGAASPSIKFRVAPKGVPFND